MIHLRPVYFGAPFQEHPQLLSIWPEPYLATAQEGVAESLALIGEEDIGAIFLVMNDQEAIGISGYFIYNEDASALGLRWHGLLEEHRGTGLSERVLEAVLGHAKQQHPNARELIELVPLSEYGAGVARSFVRMGFAPQGAAQRYEWSDHPWQPYSLDIDAFLNRSAPPQPAPRARP